MERIFRNAMMAVVVLMTLGIVSCDNQEDWRLEQEIVGAWNWYYEDRDSTRRSYITLPLTANGSICTYMRMCAAVTTPRSMLAAIL